MHSKDGLKINPKLLEILGCPICKSGLIEQLATHTLKGHTLNCETCKKKYPVVEGIPVLLPTAAIDYSFSPTTAT